MWRLSPDIDLSNDNIPAADAERQRRTAEEILVRFDDRPGLVLADEVGMGKTFVALAVAASVVRATNYARPIVVMVLLSGRQMAARMEQLFTGPPGRVRHSSIRSNPTRHRLPQTSRRPAGSPAPHHLSHSWSTDQDYQRSLRQAQPVAQSCWATTGPTESTAGDHSRRSSARTGQPLPGYRTCCETNGGS